MRWLVDVRDERWELEMRDLENEIWSIGYGSVNCIPEKNRLVFVNWKSQTQYGGLPYYYT